MCMLEFGTQPVRLYERAISSIIGDEILVDHKRNQAKSICTAQPFFCLVAFQRQENFHAELVSLQLFNSAEIFKNKFFS